jgi:hypothetical protein
MRPPYGVFCFIISREDSVDFSVSEAKANQTGLSNNLLHALYRLAIID